MMIKRGEVIKNVPIVLFTKDSGFYQMSQFIELSTAAEGRSGRDGEFRAPYIIDGRKPLTRFEVK